MTARASIQNAREDFPITSQLNFLASCGASLIPHRVAEASKGYYDQRMRGEHPDLDPIFNAARKEAAKLINAKEREIAFVKGTTEGINIVATMLDYRQGDNIVLSDIEFTSNTYPWMKAAKSANLTLRIVKNRNEAIWPSDFEKIIDNRTKAVAISHVQMANGFKCDLKEITSIAHEHGAYVAVDAIQSLGTLKVDARDLGVDFMVAGSHKWLLAPSGMGLLYVREDLIKHFEPAFIGPWQEDLVLTSPIDFTFRPYKLSDSARRFELGGHPNIPSVIGFGQALAYINEIGIENIEAKKKKLFKLSVEGILREKLSVPDWATDEGYYSSYIGYKSSVEAATVAEKAAANKITIAPSRTIIGDRIRIAPHLFNTEEEVIRATEVLGQIERGVKVSPVVS